MSWFPQTLLAIVAVCAAWIAFQQMAIARQKLNHDLFDRRFAVYIAVRDYVIAVLNRNEDLRTKAFAYHQAIAPAPFLFDAELAEYLLEVQRQGGAAASFSQSATSGVGEEARQEYFSRLNEHLQWLAAQNNQLTQRFQPTLNLSKLKPFTVREVLPFADFDKMKSRIMTIIRRH
jgi:hypothetical protein